MVTVDTLLRLGASCRDQVSSGDRVTIDATGWARADPEGTWHVWEADRPQDVGRWGFMSIAIATRPPWRVWERTEGTWARAWILLRMTFAAHPYSLWRELQLGGDYVSYWREFWERNHRR